MHRKRSQIAVLDSSGEVQVNRNVRNGTGPVLSVIGDLPSGTPVAFEVSAGWGWLVELLDDYGFQPHLVHPLACKAIASARLKNDKADAAILAQLLRTVARNRIHAVLADYGQDRPAGVWSGPGPDWLGALELPGASRAVVDDCLALIEAVEAPVARLDAQIRARGTDDPQVAVLTALPGVDTLTALMILAEVGDVTRFPSARKLASWAGLTPTVRNCDRTVGHGHI